MDRGSVGEKDTIKYFVPLILSPLGVSAGLSVWFGFVFPQDRWSTKDNQIDLSTIDNQASNCDIRQTPFSSSRNGIGSHTPSN